MSSCWPSSANEKLVTIIRTHLVRQFKKHGQPPGNTCWWNRRGQRVDRYYDPWWWPLDPGDALGDWGLLPSDHGAEEKLKSLCEVNPNSKKYPGFKGSLGAKEGAVVVLGERPSFGVMYGNFTSGLKKRLPMLVDLVELRDVVGAEPVFHVTDLIKFRGGGFEDNLTDKMIRLSLRCLKREFDHLRPAVVLVAKTDERPGRSGIDLLTKRLGNAAARLDFIYRGRIVIDVPHWSPQSQKAPGIWRDRVVEKLKTLRR